MTDLSPAAVRSWRAALNLKHPSTAAGAYRLLSAICRTAVEDEVIVRSPCRMKGGGAERAAERPTVAVAELATAVENVPEPGSLHCCSPHGASFGGARSSACRGATSTGSMERSASRGRGQSSSGSSPVIGPPKTDAGARKVALPPNVAPVLEHHLNKHVGSARCVAVRRFRWDASTSPHARPRVDQGSDKGRPRGRPLP
jgi:hypothetical protein